MYTNKILQDHSSCQKFKFHFFILRKKLLRVRSRCISSLASPCPEQSTLSNQQGISWYNYNKELYSRSGCKRDAFAEKLSLLGLHIRPPAPIPGVATAAANNTNIGSYRRRRKSESPSRYLYWLTASEMTFLCLTFRFRFTNTWEPR